MRDLVHPFERSLAIAGEEFADGIWHDVGVFAVGSIIARQRNKISWLVDGIHGLASFLPKPGALF